MRNVFTKLMYEAEKAHELALVAIVSHSGSTPRGKGSLMLVGMDGYIIGTVGGGEVEKLAVERARECVRDRTSRLLAYDLAGQKENSIGMVCGGEVLLSIQYVSPEDGEFLACVSGVLKNMDEGRSGCFVIELEGQRFELPYAPEDHALIFGGGHIALALAPILKSLGFRVSVMDDRPGFATRERFPGCNVITGDYSRVADYVSIAPEDYLVIMTNGHSHDFEIQKQVLPLESAYVGVVGSRKKTAAVNARLKAEGLTDEMTAKVHTPIGLDIKAVTPAEIAVSIAGELILCRALYKAGQGQFLEKGCPMS